MARTVTKEQLDAAAWKYWINSEWYRVINKAYMASEAQKNITPTQTTEKVGYDSPVAKVAKEQPIEPVKEQPTPTMTNTREDWYDSPVVKERTPEPIKTTPKDTSIIETTPKGNWENKGNWTPNTNANTETTVINSIQSFKDAWGWLTNLDSLIECKYWVDAQVNWDKVTATIDWIDYEWTIDEAWNPIKTEVWQTKQDPNTYFMEMMAWWSTADNKTKASAEYKNAEARFNKLNEFSSKTYQDLAYSMVVWQLLPWTQAYNDMKQYYPEQLKQAENYNTLNQVNTEIINRNTWDTTETKTMTQLMSDYLTKMMSDTEVVDYAKLISENPTVVKLREELAKEELAKNELLDQIENVEDDVRADLWQSVSKSYFNAEVADRSMKLTRAANLKIANINSIGWSLQTIWEDVKYQLELEQQQKLMDQNNFQTLYNIQQDQIANTRYNEELAYNREQYDEQLAYNRSQDAITMPTTPDVERIWTDENWDPIYWTYNPTSWKFEAIEWVWPTWETTPETTWFDFIKDQEWGFIDTAYWDVNWWAIWYGQHSINWVPVQKWDTIDQASADADFEARIDNAKFNSLVNVNLTDNQQAALYDLEHNAWPWVWNYPNGKKIIDAINNEDFAEAADIMANSWIATTNAATWKVMDILVKRRQEASKLLTTDLTAMEKTIFNEAEWMTSTQKVEYLKKQGLYEKYLETKAIETDKYWEYNPEDIAFDITSVLPRDLYKTDADFDRVVGRVKTAITQLWEAWEEISTSNIADKLRGFNIEQWADKDAVDNYKSILSHNADETTRIDWSTVATALNKWDIDGADTYIRKFVERLAQEHYWNDFTSSVEMNQRMTDTNRLKDLIAKNPDKIWKFDGNVTEFMKKFKNEPEIQELQTLLTMQQADIRKHFAWSAVTETELVALENYIGWKMTMQPDNLVAMLDTITKRTERQFLAQRDFFWYTPIERDTEWNIIKKTDFKLWSVWAKIGAAIWFGVDKYEEYFGVEDEDPDALFDNYYD